MLLKINLNHPESPHNKNQTPTIKTLKNNNQNNLKT